MTTKEYLTKYPQWQEAYDNGWYSLVGRKGKEQKQRFINATCSICGEENNVRWCHFPSLYTDGVYECSKHSIYRAIEATQKPEVVKKRVSNSAKTQIENGTGFWSDTARKKHYDNQLKNGTFFRSNMEVQIDEEFGSVHSKYSFIYELDCYWPDLNLGVEVDDPTHVEVDNPGEKQKRKGYHKEKDDYFKSLGITVLHVTFNMKDWRERIKQFLEGTYKGPLIDTTDPTYGDIVY